MAAGDEADVAAEVGELPSRHGESASDDDDAAGGGLLVAFDGSQAGRRKSGAAIAQQWFAQDVFQVRPRLCFLRLGACLRLLPAACCRGVPPRATLRRLNGAPPCGHPQGV